MKETGLIDISQKKTTIIAACLHEENVIGECLKRISSTMPNAEIADKALVLRPNAQNSFFLKANAYKKIGLDDKANEAIKDAQNASKQSAPPWRN